MCLVFIRMYTALHVVVNAINNGLLGLVVLAADSNPLVNAVELSRIARFRGLPCIFIRLQAGI